IIARFTLCSRRYNPRHCHLLATDFGLSHISTIASSQLVIKPKPYELIIIGSILFNFISIKIDLITFLPKFYSRFSEICELPGSALASPVGVRRRRRAGRGRTASEAYASPIPAAPGVQSDHPAFAGSAGTYGLRLRACSALRRCRPAPGPSDS